MKRILLLLVMLNSFSMTFSQSENNKETIGDFQIESQMSIDLEEVVITSLKSRRISCSTYCIITEVTECFTKCFIDREAEEIKTKKDSNKTVLYPNPSSNGFFILILKEKYGSIQVEVSSITGQKILSKTFRNVTNKMSLSLSRYPSGIYIINTIADGKRLPSKKAIRG